ncbi:hypothetical protein [Denitrificimonas caeni]|uniref:hypothetical protein n=1 Tax=Denitrificimonas caeni TaxID=521720 RepID=UPI001965E997|nr:hypothetical protein [Denitrificimonas caeni]
MKNSLLIKKNKQRGDILIEALIGMLLLAIIGLGLVYTISRVSVSQKDMNVHNLVVSKLREKLLAGDLTLINPIAIDGDRFTIKSYTKNISVIIDGKTVILPIYSLSATKEKDLAYKICVGPAQCEE